MSTETPNRRRTGTAPPPRPREDSPKGRRRRWLWALLLVPGTFAVLVGVGVAAYLFQTVPLPSAFDVGASVVLDADGEVVGTLSSETSRIDVDVEDLPDHVRYAVLAAEDRGFYEHGGVSLRGIARALVTNVQAGELEAGGSTITQQYVKNALLTPERTVTRKLNEAVLALKLEGAYTKDEILSFYLSTIYWGRGAYGVEAASRTYYGIPADELDPAQAAVLASIIRSPENLDPVDEPARVGELARATLDGMLEEGWLTAPTHAAAVGAPLPEVRTGSALARGPEAYYLDAVRRELGPVLGEEQLFTGLTIRTHLDTVAQAAAQVAVTDAVMAGEFDSGALVAIDPTTGGVTALVGGPDFGTQQLNVAVQGGNQVGSAFKPITLARWVEAGFSPESEFDAPAQLAIGDATFRNYGGADYGRQTLRRATATSTNTVYVAAQQQLGAATVIDTAVAMGLPPQRDDVATMERQGGLTLGQDEFTPMEMASTAATLAAGGTWRAPHLVTEVRDRDGGLLYSAAVTTREALSPNTAAVVSDVLVGAVSNGTGGAAALEGRPVAGKTGTTNDNRDAWFVGYTPTLAAAVWVGNLDDSPVEGLTGGGSAAPVWGSFAASALADTPVSAFPEPDLSGLTVLRPEPAECPDGYARGPVPTPAPTVEPGIDGEPVAPAPTPDVIDDGEEFPCVELLPEPEPEPEPTESPEPADGTADDGTPTDGTEGEEPTDGEPADDTDAPADGGDGTDGGNPPTDGAGDPPADDPPAEPPADGTETAP